MAIKLKKYKVFLFLASKVFAFALAVGCAASSITICVDLFITYDNRIRSSLFSENYFTTPAFENDMIGLQDILGKYFFPKYYQHDNPNKGFKALHQSSKLAMESYPELYMDLNTDLNNELNSKRYGGIDYCYYDILSRGPLDKEAYRKYPAYVLMDGTGIEAYPIAIAKHLAPLNWIKSEAKYGYHLYLGFKDEYIQSRTEGSEKVRQAVYVHLGYTAGLILLGVLAVLYLMRYCGKKTFDDQEPSLFGMDKLYNDISMIIMFIAMYMWFRITFALFKMKVKMPIEVFLESMVISAVLLTLFLGLCRHKKHKTLWKHTAIYRIFKWCRHIIQNSYHQGNVGKKVTMMVVGYSLLLIVTLPIFPITIFIGLRIIGNRVKDYNHIRQEIEALKEGAATGQIDIKTRGEMKNLADDVNSIRQGFNLAMESEMKSERMKTELITNVSHDLRTPLTSIITFTDLLKHDKDEENKEKHIITIEKKAHQLKKLTDDLFEAAKASSGNMTVNRTKINMLALINQAMGELHERIEEKNLIMVLEHTEPIEVMGDGRLLWRVVENLFSNIMKYALNRSRVYIDITNHEQWVAICFKNISAYRLNVPAEELMERFKRGDASRSTEGTGLGLSIVKSLMEVQGGSFHIHIDGDLFKATIQLPTHHDINP